MGRRLCDGRMCRRKCLRCLNDGVLVSESEWYELTVKGDEKGETDLRGEMPITGNRGTKVPPLASGISGNAAV